MTHKKLYAILICFVFPIMSLYSVVGSFNIAHLLAIVFMCFCLLTYPKCMSRMNQIYAPIVVYTIFQTILVVLVNNTVSGSSLFLKVAQWLLYYMLLALFNNSLFEYEIMVKVLRVTVVITCTYLLVQQILASIWHIYLPPGLTFLKYVREELKDTYIYLDKYKRVYRPRSMFSEPATFCQFALPALVIEIYRKYGKRNYGIIVLLVLSIVVSKSATGLFGIITIAVIYVIKMISQTKSIKKKTIMALLIVIPLLVIYVCVNSDIAYSINRFLGGSSFFSSILDDARLTGYVKFSYLNMESWFDVLFGKGFSSEGLTDETYLYLGGFLRHYYCFGVVGIVILFAMLLKMFIKGDSMQKTMVILVVVLSVASNPLHNNDLLIPFSFICSNRIRQDNDL